jgi:hypothetical protein
MIKVVIFLLEKIEAHPTKIWRRATGNNTELQITWVGIQQKAKLGHVHKEKAPKGFDSGLIT